MCRHAKSIFPQTAAFVNDETSADNDTTKLHRSRRWAFSIEPTNDASLEFAAVIFLNSTATVRIHLTRLIISGPNRNVGSHGIPPINANYRPQFDDWLIINWNCFWTDEWSMTFNWRAVVQRLFNRCSGRTELSIIQNFRIDMSCRIT